MKFTIELHDSEVEKIREIKRKWDIEEGWEEEDDDGFSIEYVIATLAINAAFHYDDAVHHMVVGA